jgi:glucoamylase
MKQFLLAAGLFLQSSLLAVAVRAESPSDLNQWLQEEETISLERMLRNFSPPGAAPGIIVASPSKDFPNYYFHWVRDSSLVMDVIVNQYDESVGSKKLMYFHLIRDFVTLSRQQQLEKSAEGLGEPRFLISGVADTLPWSRPQFDGPALRALTLIHFLDHFEETGDQEDRKFRGQILDVIRTDLEFVNQKWEVPCYDLWEELRGLHFYTQSVQFSALSAGAELFYAEGEDAFAARLAQPLPAMKSTLENYWNGKKGYIEASHELEKFPGDEDYKASNLDTAVILGALHSHPLRHFQNVGDDHLLATAQALEETFRRDYSINAGSANPAIGRFSEDRYFGGNPWYLTTAAFAELYYRLAFEILQQGGLKVTKYNRGFLRAALASISGLTTLKTGTLLSVDSVEGRQLMVALQTKGDGYLLTIQKYVGSQGEMSEQFDRDAGVPASAQDLTWSYAGLLSAAKAREKLISHTEQRARH